MSLRQFLLCFLLGLVLGALLGWVLFSVSHPQCINPAWAVDAGAPCR